MYVVLGRILTCFKHYVFASCNLVPDILILSETQFTYDNPRKLTAYLGNHVIRPNERAGGLSAFVRETINSYMCSDTSYNSISIEIASIAVK